MVLVQVHGKPLRALVDTGACLTLVERQHVMDFEEEPRILMAVGDHQVHVLGYARTHFRIRGQSYVHRMSVVEHLPYPVILGMDFLRDQQALVDIARGCLYLGKRERLAIYWRNHDDAGDGEELPLPSLPDQLPDDIKNKMTTILKEHRGLFSGRMRPPSAMLRAHRIELSDRTPFRTSPRRYSPEKAAEIEAQVEQMLQGGIVEPSNSPYASPVLLVKKNQGWRFCVDYRELNKRTTDVISVLPPIIDTVRDLGQARFFTSLDLTSGYWQLPMEAASKKYTAFFTPSGGQFQFTAMPFGLKLAPATFQRAMTEIFSGMLNRFVKVYLDDIIVYSSTYEEHLEHLQRVLEKIEVHQLRLNPDKCQFATTSLPYLGYEVDGKFTKARECHLLKIKQFERPKNKRQVQAFLGLVNWLRGYLPDVATLVAPMTELTGNVPFKWTDDCERSWIQTKAALEKPQRLERPHKEWKFVLQVDASEEGMGAVLMQEDSEAKRHLIHFSSSKFHKAEKQYHINEKECLAMVWAIRRYRHYLEDKHFVLRTDNRALVWLQSHQDDRAKLTRWALLLQEFSFTIEHVAGKANQLPDYLSRHAAECPEGPAIAYDELIPTPAVCVLREVEPLVKQILAGQLVDEMTQRLARRTRKAEEEGPKDDIDESLLANFIVSVEGNLFQQRQDGTCRAYVPEGMRPQVLEHYHAGENSAHPGQRETQRAINARFYWYGMQSEIRRFVQKCLVCKQIKGRNIQQAAPMSTHTPTRAWQYISIDTLGRYRGDGTEPEYAVILEDVLTKWTEAVPVKDTRHQTITEVLDAVFLRYGVPEVVIADCATNFTLAKWEKYCRKLGMRIVNSATYHQRANPVERQVQEVKKIIRALMKTNAGKRWHELLPRATGILRNRVNRATGETPAKAFLGFEPRLPGDWLIPGVQEIRQTREEHDGQLRDRKRIFAREYVRDPEQQPVTFNVGDTVLVRNHDRGTFGDPWLGPFPVIRRTSPAIYEVRTNSRTLPIHVDDLRPAPGHGNVQ